MKAWNSTLNVSKKSLKRTGMKKPKPYRRTKAQKEYHDAHLICEISKCKMPAMSTPHHIDHKKSRADTEENMYSLCASHHTFNRGVHVLGTKRFVEENGLEAHPKWVEVYRRVKDR